LRFVHDAAGKRVRGNFLKQSIVLKRQTARLQTFAAALDCFKFYYVLCGVLEGRDEMKKNEKEH
jgi:hypothetical protein